MFFWNKKKKKKEEPKIVKFIGNCKANEKHKSVYDSCPNCGKQKLHLVINKEEKIIKVECKNCHHSFDKIQCQHGPALIYWQDFTTEEAEKKKAEKAAEKKKAEKAEADEAIWDFIVLVVATLIVGWLLLLALG